MPGGGNLVILLTIYSRPGCHLCDDMKGLVARVAASAEEPTTVSDVDISGDPELERQFGLEIPVLFVNGKKAAKYRIDEERLRRMLHRARGAGEAGGAG
jgi:hypothetical protein